MDEIKNYRKSMVVIEKIGGGSINTAYLVTKKLPDGSISTDSKDREVLKILNPNTQEHLGDDIKTCRRGAKDSSGDG